MHTSACIMLLVWRNLKDKKVGSHLTPPIDHQPNKTKILGGRDWDPTVKYNEYQTDP